MLRMALTSLPTRKRSVRCWYESATGRPESFRRKGKKQESKRRTLNRSSAIELLYNNRIVELALFVLSSVPFHCFGPLQTRGVPCNFPLKLLRNAGEHDARKIDDGIGPLDGCLPALAPKLPLKEHQSVPKAFTEARELSSRLAWPLFLANSLVSSTRTHHMLVSFVVLQYRISLAR